MNNQSRSDGCNELPLPPKSSNNVRSITSSSQGERHIHTPRQDANLLDQIPPTPKQLSMIIDHNNIVSHDATSQRENIYNKQDTSDSGEILNRIQIPNYYVSGFEMTSNNYLSHSSVLQNSSDSQRRTTIGYESIKKDGPVFTNEKRQSQAVDVSKIDMNTIRDTHNTKTFYTTISHALLNGSTTDTSFEDNSVRKLPETVTGGASNMDEIKPNVRRRVRPSSSYRDLIDLESQNDGASEILTLFDPLTAKMTITEPERESSKSTLNRGLIPPPPNPVTIRIHPPQQNEPAPKYKNENDNYSSLTSTSHCKPKEVEKRSSMQSITSSLSMSSASNESEKVHLSEQNSTNSSFTFAKLRIVRRDLRSGNDLIRFTNKLKTLRSEFSFKDARTNSGLVLSPTLYSLRDDSLSVKLIIESSLASDPITFTCNIKTTIEHLISHAVCSLFEDIKTDDCMGNYLLKVTGRDEYFESHRCLADYSLVNHCCKFGMDVSLTLVAKEQARKPYSRTEEDDYQIESTLSPDDLLSNTALLDFNDLNYDSLNITIEMLEKEATKLYHSVIHKATNLQPQSLVQATKAICSYLVNSEPMSVTEAKENLAELCRTYKSEVNYMKACNTSYIEHETEQHNSPASEGTNINCTMVEVIQHALSRLLNHLAAQVEIISQNFCVDFKLQQTVSNDSLSSNQHDENWLQFHYDDDSGVTAENIPYVPSPTRKIDKPTVYIDSICDEVSLHVHLITQPRPEWFSQYQDFHLKAEIWHGVQKLAGPISTKFARQDISFFRRISFDENLVFTNFPYKSLPRESRLIITLLGTKFLPVANTQQGSQGNETLNSSVSSTDDNIHSGSPTSICSTSPMYSASPGSTTILKMHEAVHDELLHGIHYFFDSDFSLAQGVKMVGLQNRLEKLHEMVLQPDYPRRSGPFLQIEFFNLLKNVKFPDINNLREKTKTTTVIKNVQNLRLEDLDVATQQDILKIIEENKPHENLLDDERDLIWSNREYLRGLTNALPKVILSVPDWTCAQLDSIYELIEGWNMPSSVDAMQLLMPSFPDLFVREKAVNLISNLSDDELCDYLPQIVQAIRNEPYSDSPLVLMLFRKALSNARIANLLYWQFKLNTKDDSFKQRSETLLNSLQWLCGKSMRSINSRQEELLTKLTEVSNKIKNTRESQRLFALHKELESIQDYLTENKPNLPIAPSLEVCDIDIKSCSYFTSNTLPLRLAFRSCEESCKRTVKFHTYETIFKIGDDLRQDMLAIQIIRIMEKLWLREGLDLRMVTFDCLATDERQGMIELVKNSDTLRRIQAQSHFLKGPFEKKPIVEWLRIRNTSELEYQLAVDNFTHSCAGYSVATYVLGICDRHNDNIMVTHSGHLFHIDFGKFLGDAQMMGSIKRDRTPFVLTGDMAYVINGGDKPSKKFQTFIELCTMGFNIIRRNRNLFLNLFSLMTQSNIPGLSKDAVSYIDKMLMPGLTEAEAMAKFTRMIDDCLNSRSTQVNFFIHNLAQLRFSGDNQDNRTLLSFIPKTFTEATDGKIKSLHIVKYYKEKLSSSEKQYYYIIQVQREQQVQPEFVVRTYREFSELQMKLSWRFPSNTFHALQKSSIFFMDFKRSNVREVAEKRMTDLNIFLEKLLQLPENISHCDLVYTFFHPVLRDQGVSAGGDESGTFGTREYSDSTRNALYHNSNGQIKLSLVYKNASLIIMVMHAKNLPSIKGTSGPNCYAKTYLLPDPTKRSKQKTRVIRQSCHPTFMELIVYKWPLEHLKKMTLQVSLWDCDYVQVKGYLGAALIPLKDVDLMHETVAWYPLR